jgi:hypothetical protein
LTPFFWNITSSWPTFLVFFILLCQLEVWYLTLSLGSSGFWWSVWVLTLFPLLPRPSYPLVTVSLAFYVLQTVQLS